MYARVPRPFTKRLGDRKTPAQEGGSMLLVVDPTSNYESAVKDFAVERISGGSAFFAFTARGKPVQSALADVPEARFYIMTDDVNYPKPGSMKSEVLIPQNNESVLLSSFDEVISSNPQKKIAVVFDSISDLVISLGFEKSYKVLKQLLEMTAGDRITVLFLVVAGAHDDKVTSYLRSMFASHLTFDSSGLKTTR